MSDCYDLLSFKETSYCLFISTVRPESLDNLSDISVPERSGNKLRKRSAAPQPSKRPVSIILSPDAPLQATGFGVCPAKKSHSEPNMRVTIAFFVEVGKRV